MIKISNLTKKFNDYILFEIDNLELPSIGLVVIKGENGCGKTTLFNMLSLIDTDYSGVILFDGIDYKKEKDKVRSEFRKNNISYVLQKQNFISFLSIEDNQNIYDDIKEEQSTNISQLSQGQQEKKKLDSVFKIKKNIYLFDEVLSSLDEKSRKIYIKKMQNLSKEALVIIVSHDVDVENIADEIYCFKDHKIECIKRCEIKTNIRLKTNRYDLNKRKIFGHYTLSILSFLILNTIISSLFFTLIYTSSFAIKSDSIFYLNSIFNEEGFVIVRPQNDVTSSYLLNKFKGTSYLYDQEKYPIGIIETNEEVKDDTVYCTSKTLKKYGTKNEFILDKKLYYSYTDDKLFYKIEIDDSLQDGIFFKKGRKQKNICNIFYFQFDFPFYDSDLLSKTKLKDTYQKISFQSESNYKLKNDLNFKLKDDVFYVNKKELFSSKHVTSFSKPSYTSKNDCYEPNFNEIFKDGVDTVFLENDKNSFYPSIIVSDNTAQKIYNGYNDHNSIIIVKSDNSFNIVWYLFIKNYILHQHDLYNSNLTIEKYNTYVNANADYTGLFTYSLLLYFFLIFSLFLELTIYYQIIRKNNHNFYLLYSLGLNKKKIFIHSILPLFISILLSSLIGGLISLTQSKMMTSFIFSTFLFILFIFCLITISILLFKKGIKNE